VVRDNVVKPSTSKSVRELMEYVVSRNHRGYGLPTLKAEYSIGGKTGTAQVAQPGGGYYSNRFNGTFAGFVGGDEVQYIIIVRVNDPKIAGYASQAAAPLFSDLATMLMNNFSVTPKQ
jgi:cell division protein FtsI/penicillin-binding protein 2